MMTVGKAFVGASETWTHDNLAWSQFVSVVGEEAKNMMARTLVLEVLEENRT